MALVLRSTIAPAVITDEFDAVGDYFCDVSFLTIVPLVRADLQTTLDCGLAAFGKIFGTVFTGFIPYDNINKVSFPIAPLVGKRTIDS